jgi:hypothetical protein
MFSIMKCLTFLKNKVNRIFNKCAFMNYSILNNQRIEQAVDVSEGSTCRLLKSTVDLNVLHPIRIC